MQRPHADLSINCSLDNVAVVWLNSGKVWASSIYSSQMKQWAAMPGSLNSKMTQHWRWSVKQWQLSKAVELYSSNSIHYFRNKLILFLHVFYCSSFHSAAFAILDLVCSSLHSAIEHACLVCTCLFITECISVSKSVLLYSLPLLFWHKQATTKFNPCGWLQRCHFAVPNTYCIYVKT